MRLIDVDALKNDGHLYIHDSDGKDYYEVDHAPTVNPYEWISVEDKLPEKNQEVLVYRGDHSGLMNVYTYMDKNEWEDDYGYWGRTYDEGITHWMPLPKSPEKEN